ncbi:glutamate--tRNA ligase family protein [Neorhodopirellula pilleata]|uniref:Glutamate--tRNA ligase 1 n=1 Tax=Neorhodopirellula pilleata TaxID=2714738 RepID=A0A5C6AUL4_9BACT|nr:glutamate--tRNA ligase family protein [Neorhodopirellula pilleata]TWU03131.1 Glutamate--tRNA ligase 1 [Neorhodopirellula pilleata]
MTRSPVCRLAPSPTGAQHLGNARTFLIAYWSARSQNARLLLRIEDIDSPRIKPWATAQVFEDLAWLGIQYDGEPVIQTERSEVYQSVLRNLIEDDRVYPCVCSRKDIDEAASAPHEHSVSASSLRATSGFHSLEPETTIYPGTCSSWHRGQAMPPDGDYCLRFRIDPHSMRLDDLVAGTVHCDPTSALGDFPVTRKEGVAAYQIAVVIDDVDAGVTEVVRGDDLLASAFRQRQIYDYLRQSPPQYAHVPLVVGADGRRLAKRHGDTRLSWYRDQGVHAKTIVAWAANSVFGHQEDFPQPDQTRDWTLDQWHQAMIDQFDWSRVSQSKTVITSPDPAELRV